jgi:hypothetical protein
VQNRVAARYVEIGCSADFFAHINAAFHNAFHFVKRHFGKLFAIIFGKNIAVPASLVAHIGYMPLKSKIRFHRDSPFCVIIYMGFYRPKHKNYFMIVS